MYGFKYAKNTILKLIWSLKWLTKDVVRLIPAIGIYTCNLYLVATH